MLHSVAREASKALIIHEQHYFAAFLRAIAPLNIERSRNQLEASATTMAPQTPTPPQSLRSVRFSHFSTLAVVPRDDTEAKSYSRDDMNRFKRDLLSSVQYALRDQAEATPQEDCLGIEVFVKKGLGRHVQERRRAHTRAIITRQNILSKEELSYLSGASSKWARERAVKTALGYS